MVSLAITLNMFCLLRCYMWCSENTTYIYKCTWGLFNCGKYLIFSVGTILEDIEGPMADTVEGPATDIVEGPVSGGIGSPSDLVRGQLRSNVGISSCK